MLLHDVNIHSVYCMVLHIVVVPISVHCVSCDSVFCMYCNHVLTYTLPFNIIPSRGVRLQGANDYIFTTFRPEAFLWKYYLCPPAIRPLYLVSTFSNLVCYRPDPGRDSRWHSAVVRVSPLPVHYAFSIIASWWATTVKLCHCVHVYVLHVLPPCSWRQDPSWCSTAPDPLHHAEGGSVHLDWGACQCHQAHGPHSRPSCCQPGQEEHALLSKSGFHTSGSKGDFNLPPSPLFLQ